jgi:hypothetical protein
MADARPVQTGEGVGIESVFVGTEPGSRQFGKIPSEMFICWRNLLADTRGHAGAKGVETFTAEVVDRTI